MSNDFYKKFEDKYRGSREVIKERLKIYLPFVLGIKNIYPSNATLDLGCGRGEWLELLAENDILALGVDSDESMLKESEMLGLNVTLDNALTYIKQVPDSSYSIVSAFHFVEHIPFPSLQELVKEALRVLVPGGLLIMETPNPENITVGSCNFYMDPNNNKPIPPNLLAFVPEYYGYKNIKLLRLQEPKKVKTNFKLKIYDIFTGVSPDYAVIAQKDGSDAAIASTKDAFAKDYGMTLEHLSVNYHRLINYQWIKYQLTKIKRYFAA